MNFSVKEQYALRHAARVAFAARFGLRAEAADPIVETYVARQEELVADSQAIIARADAEKRELSVEDKAAITNNSAEVERLQGEIEQRRTVMAQANRLRDPQPRVAPLDAADPLPRASDDDSPPQRRIVNIQTTNLRQPAGNFSRDNGGFRNMAEFAHAVRRATNGQGLDQRLHNAAASTYGNEGVGADGGFAVPPEFKRDIQVMVTGEDSMLARCDAMPTESNSVTVPTDETTPWGTTGVRAYWGAEAAALSQSKPALKEHTTRLHKLHALVPMSDELVEDAPMAASLITRKSAEALNFAVTDAIFNGTGVGKPLGILNSPALVSVAAEGSQAADTIQAPNVMKMWARMPATARGRAVWVCNQDAEPQLMKMGVQIGDAAQATFTGGVPLFIPPGGLSASPYATLLGRPVITTEAMPALGEVGDLLFAYLPGYFAPYKAGGVKSSISMHLWFDQDLTAFKWTLRIGGQPWLQAPIDRKNGTNTLSHFVAIAAR